MPSGLGGGLGAPGAGEDREFALPGERSEIFSPGVKGAETLNWVGTELHLHAKYANPPKSPRYST